MKPQLKQPQTSDDDKYNEDTQTTKKQQQQPYKIYLLSPYKASQTFVCLSDISDEYFEMRLVTEKNKHLWHLSLALPPSLRSEFSRTYVAIIMSNMNGAMMAVHLRCLIDGIFTRNCAEHR
eukprot:179403_1